MYLRQVSSRYSVAMRLSISHKLVIAFLGLTSLVLAATLGLAGWSFERGFLDYVNALEKNRLEQARVSLAREYVRSGGNWDFLTPEQFAGLIRESGASRAAQGPLPGRPPPGGVGDLPPPPGRGPGPGMSSHPQPGPPTALYDQNDVLIAGDPVDQSNVEPIRLPIIVRDEVVGELKSTPAGKLESPLDTAFAAQQRNASLLIGLASLVLAMSLSMLLAKGLLAPVRRMIGQVKRLSNGDYTARMANSRNDELGRLNSDLDRLAKTLDEARTSRRRWLADVSHELRTPVAVLTAELEGLQDGVLDFDRKRIDSLHQEAQRLRRLIDDLYDLSLSDVGGLRYEFSETRLDECVGSAVGAVRSRAEERAIKIRVDAVPVTVNADHRRLMQLLQNVLENSLAYTDSPGRIDVRMETAGNSAIVTIDDTPPGIAAADAEQLFGPFFRLEESRNRRTGGAGLGLAICRNIVEAHGGSIVASPSELGGVQIRIDLPLDVAL